GYSASWTAFRAMMDLICTNPMDKVGLTAAASQEGTIARVIFAMISGAILAAFTSAQGAVAPIGYTVVNLVFGLISVVCFILVSAICKKYDNVPADPAKASKRAAAPKFSAEDFFKTIKTRPMLIFILCAIFRCAVLTVMGTLLAYYLAYVLGNPDLAQIYMMLVYAISFFGAMLVQPLAKKIGKRPTFVWTTLLSGICVLALIFTGTNSVAFIVLMCLFQFFGIFSSTLIPVCMADIGEYNALTVGAHARGLVFSIGGMAIQISSVVGAALASFGMVLVGFDPGVATEAGIAGLKGLYIYGLAGLSLASALLFLLYPLTEKYMEELRAKHAGKETA
ncbi:MAG: MFS transporter, partial [Clostridia bacterium]|nr:MFS transporter [Clostridia bacterium]